jgi:outer membrane receptor protein involved in Fe transport
MTFHRFHLAVRCLALFILAAFLGSMAANAQSTTQGAISGTVMDASGAVVPGAAIKIQNSANGFVTNLVADSSGYFKAPLLEPGIYSVSITAPNFANYRADNVVVVVGQVTSLTPHLAIASSSAQVVVTEQVPVINTDSPDFSDTVNLRALNNIPINIRRWSALAMTTPGVVADSSGFGLVSVRGVSTLLNNVEIDGADDNQAYFSEERGRTREAYSTSASAVREFAVNTGVYSAEYGRAAGGVITSVTKSGTNQLHGSAYFWDRESKWAASNEFSTLTTLNPTTDTNQITPFKAEDLRKIYGFTAGGPLIKDKLFWIYTYDQHTRIFPTVGVPDSPSAFYATPPAADSSCNTTTGYTPSSTTLDQDVCALAARQKISYAAAATDYNNAINALSGDIGEVSRAGYQEINTPKLDWQINDKEHVSVLFHRLRWDSPGGVQTSSTDHYARDTQGNDFVKLDYGLTKLTSLISSNISNEVLYQYGRELDDETQQPLTSYSSTYLEGTNGVVVPGGMSPNVPEVAESTSTSGFYIGSPYYSYRLQYPLEQKWQVGDILYWNKGNHSLKFGADLVHNFDEINNTYESNGYFSYTTPSDYVNDWLNKANGVNAATSGTGCNSSATATQTSSSSTASPITGTDPCYVDFYQGYGNPVFNISTMDYGFFGQDNWKFSPRLTFELGLRYDYEKLPSAASNLTTATGSFVPYTQLNNNPSDKMALGPRIGFAWDVYGKGNTVLRGGYGLYYGRITNGNLLNARLDTGSPNGQYSVTYNKSLIGPQLPNIEPITGGAPPSPSSDYMASNLKNPEVHEFDMMLQQAVGRGTFFQLSYLGALGRLLPNYLDFNLQPASLQNVQITVSDSTGKGPIPNGTIFYVPTYTVAPVNMTTGAVGTNYGNSSGFGNTALFGSQATNYQGITEMISNINSSYNALVAEVQNRSLRSIEFDANYTWSHALDFSQNASTAPGTEGWYDPFANPRVNYANSTWDIPNRFEAYAIYNFPNLNSGNPLKWAANDWSLSDNYWAQNGLPFTLSTSSGYNSDAAAGEGFNGSGGSTYIPAFAGVGINTYRYPRRMVDDIRLQKAFAFEHGYNLQLIANAFNVANHQNVDGMNSTAYLYSDAGSSGLTTGSAPYPKDLASTLTYQTTFNQITSKNATGFLLTPREFEISARLQW